MLKEWQYSAWSVVPKTGLSEHDTSQRDYREHDYRQLGADYLCTKLHPIEWDLARNSFDALTSTPIFQQKTIPPE